MARQALQPADDDKAGLSLRHHGVAAGDAHAQQAQFLSTATRLVFFALIGLTLA